jgi:Arc/MetJ-type ribon-helix-helix transcriptional regulator
MRTTKNLTVSLPPAMLRDMEKAAKRENRTLSELVRENFRRSQKQQDIDIYQLIRQIAPPPPELKAMWQEAKRKGTDKLTMAEIDREVAAVRRQHDKKKKTSKRPRQ